MEATKDFNCTTCKYAACCWVMASTPSSEVVCKMWTPIGNKMLEDMRKNLPQAYVDELETNKGEEK